MSMWRQAHRLWWFAAFPLLACAQASASDLSNKSSKSKVTSILIGVGIGTVVGISIVVVLIYFKVGEHRLSMKETNVRIVDERTGHSSFSRQQSTRPVQSAGSGYVMHPIVEDSITLGHKQIATSNSIHSTLRSSNPTIEIGEDFDVPMMEEWADDESSASDDIKTHDTSQVAYYSLDISTSRPSLIVIDPSNTTRDGFYL